MQVPEHPVYHPAAAPVDPGSRLLAEAAAPAGTVLAVNMAPDPALLRWAVVGAHLSVQDERCSALNYARRLLEGVAADLEAAIAPQTPWPDAADVALINLRYLWGRQATRASIGAALAGLRPGGRLLLAGANDRGVRSAVDDLAAAAGGRPQILAYGKGHRLVAVAKPEGWSAPAPAPPGERVMEPVGGVPITLERRPGLFAEGLADAGTQLLAKSLPVAAPGQHVLDLGCGGGAVAVHAALHQPLARVWAVDDSLRAVRAAVANAVLNGVAGTVLALHGDGLQALPADLRFDLVATNPPFHFGAIATTALAEAWLRALPTRMRPGGRLYVVYNAFLPYLRVLGEAFGADRAALVAEAGGYRVAGAVWSR